MNLNDTHVPPPFSAWSSYVQLQQRRFHRQQPGLVSVSDQAGTKKVEKTEFSDLRFN